MRLKGGPWGLIVGIILGFSVGSASVATAMFGYKGWQRFGGDFQLGYLAGFFDMANLARNLEPGGYVDEHFPVWPEVKVLEWRTVIDELYKNPANQEYGMYAIVQLAAKELAKVHGPAPTAIERLAPKLKEQLERARDPKQQAQRPATAAPADKKPTVSSGASKAHDPWTRKYRWCRCTAVEKKAEKQKRKETREQARKAKASEQAPKASEQASKAVNPEQPAAPPAGNSGKTEHKDEPAR